MQVVQVYGRERLEVIGAVLSALQRSGKVTLLWLLGSENGNVRVYRLAEHDDGVYYGVAAPKLRLVARIRDGRAEIINVKVLRR